MFWMPNRNKTRARCPLALWETHGGLPQWACRERRLHEAGACLPWEPTQAVWDAQACCSLAGCPGVRSHGRGGCAPQGCPVPWAAGQGGGYHVAWAPGPS